MKKCWWRSNPRLFVRIGSITNKCYRIYFSIHLFYLNARALVNILSKPDPLSTLDHSTKSIDNHEVCKLIQLEYIYLSIFSVTWLSEFTVRLQTCIQLLFPYAKIMLFYSNIIIINFMLWVKVAICKKEVKVSFVQLAISFAIAFF